MKGQAFQNYSFVILDLLIHLTRLAGMQSELDQFLAQCQP